MFRAHFLVERSQRFAIETGANFSGKEKLVVFVVADKDCPEMFACTSRRSVAANDKLLLIDAFYFDPGTATPAPERTQGALRLRLRWEG